MIFPQKNVEFLHVFSIFGRNFKIGILMKILCFRHILPTFDRHLKTWFYHKKTTFFQKNVSKSQHVTWFSKLGFSSFSVRNHDSSHPRENDFWWFFWSKPFFFSLKSQHLRHMKYMFFKNRPNQNYLSGFWSEKNTKMCFFRKYIYREIDLKKP